MRFERQCAGPERDVTSLGSCPEKTRSRCRPRSSWTMSGGCSADADRLWEQAFETDDDRAGQDLSDRAELLQARADQVAERYTELTEVGINDAGEPPDVMLDAPFRTTCPPTSSMPASTRPSCRRSSSWRHMPSCRPTWPTNGWVRPTKLVGRSSATCSASTRRPVGQ